MMTEMQNLAAASQNKGVEEKKGGRRVRFSSGWTVSRYRGGTRGKDLTPDGGFRARLPQG